MKQLYSSSKIKKAAKCDRLEIHLVKIHLYACMNYHHQHYSSLFLFLGKTYILQLDCNRRSVHNRIRMIT